MLRSVHKCMETPSSGIDCGAVYPAGSSDAALVHVITASAYIKQLSQLVERARIVGVIMTAYALGGFTPLYALFYWAIPGVSFFRRPADATFLVGGLMAIVSGYLAHRVAAGPAPQKLGRPHATEACLYISLFALALAITIWMGHVSDAIKPVVVAAIGLIVARILVHFIERRGGQSVLACLTAVAAAMTLDLRINNGPNESTGLSVNRYEFMNPNCQNTTIRFLKAKLDQPPLSPRRDRVELVGLGFSWPNLGCYPWWRHEGPILTTGKSR